MPAQIRFRSRKAFAKSRLHGLKQPPGDAAPLSGRINGFKPVRDSGSRAKAKRRAADPDRGSLPRWPDGDRREDWPFGADVGGAVREPGRTLELALESPEIQPVGISLQMGKPPREGTRRTLLRGVAVPLPPTINAYEQPRPVYSEKLGRWIAMQYVTSEGRAYQLAIRQAMMDLKAWYYSAEPLHLRMLVCFKDRRVQDVDNRIKPMQDALKFAGVFKDDSQIKTVEARQGPILKPAVCFLWLDEFIPDPVANLRWIQNPVG